MTERKKDLLYLAALLAVLILFFSKILFTDQIIRAPDITNEFYWNIQHFKNMGFWDLFRVNLRADWDMYVNGGGSEGGGLVSQQFLFYRSLIFWLLPTPANIAWFIVFHLFFGAAGTYLFCRVIGCGRVAAFLGGLIFAIAPENASLINAGHVQKIATISFAPWAFYFFERGFQTRRFVFPLATGVVLAFQFFNTHWQIAYYTCLGIGVYGVLRSVGILLAERRAAKRAFTRLLGLNLVTMLFFVSTVAISLVPLADWSKETTRGAQSGANQGKGGLNVEEAMSWSLPPEELATFVIPGFFGLSRQEGGFNSNAIDSYYWGRMVFTQTTDYMGLLPWLLLPLPLLFRRDRYTWLALAGIALGILFSMGKYSSFYWSLYEHFPGINRFRVPKMMMFIPVLGLGVLAARGIDCLLDEEVRRSRKFKGYLASLAALPVVLLACLGVELAGKDYWLGRFGEMLSQPTRYEQGPQLVVQRWNNLVRETGTAAAVAAVYAGAIIALCRRQQARTILCGVLLLLYLVDVGRVNAKFMLLQPRPEHARGGGKTPVMEYLARDGKFCRVQPMNGSDPMIYASNGIPVMFTSNPVQMQRWQDFLDAFSFTSAMPDLFNVKYLIYDPAQYAQERAQLGEKFVPVYQSPDGRELVVENRRVLPKAWLVPEVIVASEPRQALQVLQNPAFDPRRAAVVDSPPPIHLAAGGAPGEVTVTRYEANHVGVRAVVGQNSLLVLGDRYFKYWRAEVDGKRAPIHPVDYVLRGVYLTPGTHTVEFRFDPMPFKIGKTLTLASFAFFALMLGREWRRNRKEARG